MYLTCETITLRQVKPLRHPCNNIKKMNSYFPLQELKIGLSSFGSILTLLVNFLPRLTSYHFERKLHIFLTAIYINYFYIFFDTLIYLDSCLIYH